MDSFFVEIIRWSISCMVWKYVISVFDFGALGMLIKAKGMYHGKNCRKHLQSVIIWYQKPAIFFWKL